MRQEKKALKDMRINGSLFLYNLNLLNMVTDSTNHHCPNKVTLSELILLRYSERKRYYRDAHNFELNLFFQVIELDI